LRLLDHQGQTLPRALIDARQSGQSYWASAFKIAYLPVKTLETRPKRYGTYFIVETDAIVPRKKNHRRLICLSHRWALSQSRACARRCGVDFFLTAFREKRFTKGAKAQHRRSPIHKPAMRRFRQNNMAPLRSGVLSLRASFKKLVPGENRGFLGPGASYS